MPPAPKDPYARHLTRPALQLGTGPAIREVRVMIVDDSATFRKIFRDVLGEIPGTYCVGHARNGEEALEKIPGQRPDLVILDVEMPILGGLETLAEIRKRHPGVAVVMTSALSSQGADMTMKALQSGAIHFIIKPEGVDDAEGRAELLRQFPSILEGLLVAKHPAEPPEIPAAAQQASLPTHGPSWRPKVILIGASTGGPDALGRLLGKLPAGFPVPIVIVQHMPPLFTAVLARSLCEKSAIEVKEAFQGAALDAGKAFLAPGGMQMGFSVSTPGKVHLVLSEDPPENHCRPAVDFTFRSAAEVFGPDAAAVILTGMGSDGTEGLRRLKSRGAWTLGQDKASCVVHGMPRAAQEAGLLDGESDPEGLALLLLKAFESEGRR